MLNRDEFDGHVQSMAQRAVMLELRLSERGHERQQQDLDDRADEAALEADEKDVQVDGKTRIRRISPRKRALQRRLRLRQEAHAADVAELIAVSSTVSALASARQSFPEAPGRCSCGAAGCLLMAAGNDQCCACAGRRGRCVPCSLAQAHAADLGPVLPAEDEAVV